MRILVMGTGAVGGYFGAKLSVAGKDVTCVARGAMLQALRKKRLEVRGTNPFAAPHLRSLVLEAAAVAEAAGVSFNQDRIEQTLEFIEKFLARSRTSTLQDIERGKRIEYNGLNGAIARAAEKHAVPVPLNRCLFALLSLINPAREQTV